MNNIEKLNKIVKEQLSLREAIAHVFLDSTASIKEKLICAKQYEWNNDRLDKQADRLRTLIGDEAS